MNMKELFLKALIAVAEFVKQLFRAPAFYPASLALAHAILFFFYPDFPRDIVTAADGLIAVFAVILTGQSVTVQYRQARAARLEQAQAAGRSLHG